ncbi:hypothetical protein THAOC_02830, partial [Thalassiosira oceanica]
KLRRDGDRSEGDAIIGEILSEGHVLIPFAVDGYGGLGPMAGSTIPVWRPTPSGTNFPSGQTQREGLFFLSVPLAITSYHTNKTRLTEAPFGLVGDDNGPGLEPPPRNRIGIATAFMPSRRRSPAAVGKPSFPYFKADYLPRRREQF